MAKKTRSAEPTLRDRLTSAFVEALEKDWTEHGTEVIERIRLESPAKYGELIARLIPIESSLIAASDYSQCETMDDIGRKLLRQIGVLDDAMTEPMVQAAVEANAVFIDRLEVIARGN